MYLQSPEGHSRRERVTWTRREKSHRKETVQRYKDMEVEPEIPEGKRQQRENMRCTRTRG